jgi:hypothetical protein
MLHTFPWRAEEEEEVFFRLNGKSVQLGYFTELLEISLAIWKFQENLVI